MLHSSIIALSNAVIAFCTNLGAPPSPRRCRGSLQRGRGWSPAASLPESRGAGVQESASLSARAPLLARLLFDPVHDGLRRVRAALRQRRRAVRLRWIDGVPVSEAEWSTGQTRRELHAIACLLDRRGQGYSPKSRITAARLQAGLTEKRKRAKR